MILTTESDNIIPAKVKMYLDVLFMTHPTISYVFKFLN